MANYYGTPAIVTDGLIFAVDAGNDQSYVTASLDTFSLVSSETGSLKNETAWNSTNQGTWTFEGTDDYIDCGDVAEIPIRVLLLRSVNFDTNI
jgi:hypothetical protein